MAIEYQFNNRFNWFIVHDQTYTATNVNPSLERFNPIPPIKLGYTIDSPIIAFYCANSEAQGNWKYGARYLAKMTTTLLVGQTEPDTVLKAGKFFPNCDRKIDKLCNFLILHFEVRNVGSTIA